VTCTEAPWTAARTSAPDLSLVLVPQTVLRALAAGDHDAAEHLFDATIPPYLAGPDCRGVWRLRSEQVAATPTDHVWVTRLVVDRASGTAVGMAGFHGAPDDRGMVEIGYRIIPDVRRRGHARAALEVMLDVARDDLRVSVVRATISPDNVASRALVAQYGFREVGEQWDDEDGLETIFEVPARPLSAVVR